jgi:hypothetical protein
LIISFTISENSKNSELTFQRATVVVDRVTAIVSRPVVSWAIVSWTIVSSVVKLVFGNGHSDENQYEENLKQKVIY